VSATAWLRRLPLLLGAAAGEAWQRRRSELRRWETICLLAILALGVALRAYFLVRWRPALLGFPDSATYVQIAHTGIFDNPLRVGGYAEFLRLLHAISPHLRFAIAVQHALGMVTGLLLYGIVRRAGGPRWLALVPTAVVVLGGSELFIEHAPLSESLFAFLVNLALYCFVRSWHGRAAWAGAGGLALGLAADVRVIGEAIAAVMLVAALLAAPAPWRRRVLLGGLIVIATAVPIAFYTHEREATIHQAGMTSTGYFDLYARVAPFARCEKFHPPRELQRLCISMPVSRRLGHDHWEFTPISPAFRVFGSPDASVSAHENPQLRRFALDAILGQPLSYLEYVGRDLIRIVDPSFASSPYPQIGIRGYGNTPASLLNYYFLPSSSANAELAIASYYPAEIYKHHDISLLTDWEMGTRLEGPAMALLLVLALLAPLLTGGDQRRASALLLASSAVLLVAPILVSEYDYRFTIPAFGTLAAAAAYGAWGAGLRLLPLLRSLRRRKAGGARSTPHAGATG
jgi:Dolichyl-phosphate-mannose-protein mannosyltransferase